LLHVDVRPVVGPLRALDRTPGEAADPTPGGPAAGPGRQVLVRVPAAHARAAGAGLARAARRGLAAAARTPRDGAPGRLSDRVPAVGRGPRRLALPGQCAAPAAQPARGRLRARPRAAHHAP